MNKMPDRWLPYKPVGDVISGTRFIAFKVPLNERFFHSGRDIASKDHFTPQILLDKVQDLGMIIDLTATTRYYNPREFEDNDVQYIKIFTEGHQVPSRDVISKFTRAVNNFLERNGHNDKKIGVHCTHGVNRTGYLICHYMIRQMKMDPKDAIERFGIARGYPIERENYLDSLNSLRLPDDMRKKEKIPVKRDHLANDRNRDSRSQRRNPTSNLDRSLNSNRRREHSPVRERSSVSRNSSTNWRISRVSRIPDQPRGIEQQRNNDQPRIYEHRHSRDDRNQGRTIPSRDSSFNRNYIRPLDTNRHQNGGHSYRSRNDDVPQPQASSLQPQIRSTQPMGSFERYRWTPRNTNSTNSVPSSSVPRHSPKHDR